MMIAALAVLPAIILEQTAASPVMAALAWSLNAVIWGAFLTEYIVLLSVSDDRREFIRTHKLDLLIVILSPPFLVPEAMAAIRVVRVLRIVRLARASRLVRAARLLRFLRLVTFSARAFRAANTVLRRHSLHYALLLALLLLFLGGGLFFWLEPNQAHNIFEGLWWAVTTLTTVGYGDITPETGWGRVLAALLMIFGIGFMAILTAAIASWFIDHDDRVKAGEDTADRLSAVEQRLDTIILMLSRSNLEIVTARDDGDHDP